MTDGAPASVWRDGWRLSVGTLTVLPVRPPSRVDRPRAALAMAVAPLTSLVLAVPAAAVAWGGWTLGTPPAVVAVVVVALLALGNRGMHLDGLADTADGLGAPQDAEGRLAIMRRGDVGPLGAVALVVVLGAQVAALSVLLSSAAGWAVLLAVVVASRAALVVVCARGVPAARSSGLGAAVSGTVGRWTVLTVWLAVALVVLAGAWWDTAFVADFGWFAYERLPVAEFQAALLPMDRSPWWWVQPVVAVAAALAAVAVLVWRCVRVLGGVTGDVCGAAVELALAVLLVALVV